MIARIEGLILAARGAVVPTDFEATERAKCFVAAPPAADESNATAR